MNIPKKSLANFILIFWLALIVYAIFEVFSTDFSRLAEAFNFSFVRVMFVDIGALSTILAAWIYFGTESRLKGLFAILTMFIGSFGFLPFLVIYLRSQDKLEQKTTTPETPEIS